MNNKRLLSFIPLVLLLFVFCGCTDKKAVTYTLEGDATMLTGTSTTLTLAASDNVLPEFLSWQSSDSSLATVADDGVVSALAAGTVTITVSFADTSVSHEITISTAPLPLQFEGYTSIAVGASATWVALEAQGDVSWSSSDEAVLSSLGGGVFKALATGTATITARTATQEGTITVTVSAEPYLTVSEDVFDLYTGHEGQIHYDTNSTTFVTFQSSNRTAVEVSTSGLIRAIAPGFATITVRSGTLTTEVYVTVTDLTYEVMIDGVKRKGIEGESIGTMLTRVFGSLGHEEKTGYNFIGWYLESDFTTSASMTDPVTAGLTLYARYAAMAVQDYEITINRVLRENSTFSSTDACQALTADWQALTGRDLSDHDLYVATFSLTLNLYTITSLYTSSTDAKMSVAIPQDGFVIAVNTSADNASLYRSYISLGTKIGLSSYTIMKSTKLTLNPKAQSASNAVTLASGQVSASYSTIYDASTSTFLWDKNSTAKAYPASMTKMMTALTALRLCSLDDVVTIGDELDVMNEGSSPSTAGIIKGEVWTLRELLYAMLLPSGNDAAYSIAALTIKVMKTGSGLTMRQKMDLFCTYMNETASLMGLVNSHFAVPDGNSYYNADGTWDDRIGSNYSCARDMAVIGSYCLRHPALALVMDTSSKSITIGSKTYTWSNTNSLVNSNGILYVGCKTGTTNWAGPCVTVARWLSGRLVIAVVMKASTSAGRYTDASALFTAYDAAQA